LLRPASALLASGRLPGHAVPPDIDVLVLEFVGVHNSLSRLESRRALKRKDARVLWRMSERLRPLLVASGNFSW
jgi:hypothetical protein